MIDKTDTPDKSFNLKGQLLLAMPRMEDTRFARSVILICSHGDEGCMGFILNQPISTPKFPEILEELDIDIKSDVAGEDVQVFCGGPVEQGRGFVLHSLDYSSSSSARVDDLGAVTATLDVLRKLVSEEPPIDYIMMLGYAGWAEGQLEEEIAQNGWLTMPATRKIVFQTPHDQQYSQALSDMGISEALLSASAGHA